MVVQVLWLAQVSFKQAQKIRPQQLCFWPKLNRCWDRNLNAQGLFFHRIQRCTLALTARVRVERHVSAAARFLFEPGCSCMIV